MADSGPRDTLAEQLSCCDRIGPSYTPGRRATRSVGIWPIASFVGETTRPSRGPPKSNTNSGARSRPPAPFRRRDSPKRKETQKLGINRLLKRFQSTLIQPRPKIKMNPALNPTQKMVKTCRVPSFHKTDPISSSAHLKPC